MKKLLSCLFLVALCSSPAMANPVPLGNYTVEPLLGPPGLPLERVAFIAPGDLNGTTLTVTLRNYANEPIVGATVNAYFNSQIKTCSDAVLTTVTTAPLGQCTLLIRGGGCVTNVIGAFVITANGIEILNLKHVRSPDNTSHTLSAPDGTVSVADLTYFGDEFKGMETAVCHDYDNNHVVNVTDLTYFGDAFKGQMSCTLN